MKNINLIRIRLFALTIAAVIAVVLTSALSADAQDEMSGMSMGKKNPPKSAQSGMQMGQGAKKKAPKKSTGMSSKGSSMGMEDDMDDDKDEMCCMKMMGSMGARQTAKKKGMGGMKMSSARTVREQASLQHEKSHWQTSGNPTKPVPEAPLLSPWRVSQ